MTDTTSTNLDDYLRKCIREVPMGVLRELLARLQKSYTRRLKELEQAGADELTKDDKALCIGYLGTMLANVDEAISFGGDGFCLKDLPDDQGLVKQLSASLLDMIG